MTKEQQILTYLIDKNPESSITVLMKLIYLIDLVGIKKLDRKISAYNYRRYNFGPFDSAIYTDIEHLTTDAAAVVSEPTYSPAGNEYIIYKLNNDFNPSYDLISEDEKQILDEVLESVRGYGAKALTEIAYKTRPMAALGATLGGGENMNAELDLSH